MFDAYLGTKRGVHVLRGAATEPLGLEEERISAIHAWRADGETIVLAGT
jgi:hypothetical protein